MPIDIKPVQSQVRPDFAGEVFGLDLRGPLGAADIAAIHAGMDRYAVLVFHGQRLTNEDHVAFTARLGPLVPNVGTNVTRPGDRRLDHNFADVSNVGPDDKLLPVDSRRRQFSLANRLWHSDNSFRAVPPKYSLLYGHVVPPPGVGGETEFADMRAAYHALDDETKSEIEDLVCEHSQLFSRAMIGFTEWSAEERELFKPVLQRLVRYHPDMGNKKTLYLSAHLGGIVGWPRPEAMAFIRDLTEHATQRQFVYTHRWRQGDLVIWDNRQTMHRGLRFDDQKYRRDVRRTTIMGDGPTVEQQAA